MHPGVPRIIGPPWTEILLALHIDFRGRPFDEFISTLARFVEEYKGRFLATEPFNRIFDILEMIMRRRECPSPFINDIAAAFEDCRLAYVVDRGFPVMILPAATPEEGAAIRNALEDVRAAGLPAAESHLRESGRLINAGDWAGSVRESINAVESVARRIEPEAQTLGSALKKMGGLHPALKEAFSSLYGYTSDEQGIRHARLDEAASPAQQDEAVFMLGACASFVSYMLRKHRQSSRRLPHWTGLRPVSLISTPHVIPAQAGTYPSPSPARGGAQGLRRARGLR